MVRSPVLRLKPSLALPLLLGGFWASFAAPLRAQVSGGGLNTTVDGVVGGSCSTGLCQVTAGTVVGSNLFHRFSSFDTRGAITGVQIHNGGLPNVVVGVTAPLGSFIDKPVSLTAPGNLTWLSPGGIAVSGLGGFVNTNELTLSTATQQLVGAGRFDVFGTTPQQAALLSGTPGTRARDLVLDPAVRAMAGMAPDPQIVLNGVQLTVDRSLLVDNPGGLVSVAGSTLSAASATGQGGSISLTGPQVWVDGASSLLATGPTGGGLIQVGGSWQNSNADVRQAITTWVGSGALLDASATVQGDGGTIVVWSDIADPRGATAVAGTLRAQGGPDGGNGGQVETSGAWLGVNGIAVSTLAPRGTAGTWLLDPDNLIVSTNTTTAAFTTSPITYTANSNESYVNIGDINNSLPFSNVTLLASNDITIDSSIFYSQTPGSAPGNLTLNAGGKIILNSSISLDAGSVDSPLVLKLQSGSGLWGAGSIELANGTASAASLIINQVGNSEYYGSIIGELNLVKQQAGRLSLFGTNSYSGGTEVEGGVLRAQSSSALGQASGLVSVSDGAAVELAGGIELQNNFNLRGTGVGNSGSLRNISEKNSISGVVTLLTQSTNLSSSSGSLTFAAVGSQESLKMGSNVTSAFQFVVGGAGDLIFNKAINLQYGTAGSNTFGDLVKYGSGSIFLNAANKVGGSVRVEGGTLAYSSQNVFEGFQGSRILRLNGSSFRSMNNAAGTMASQIIGSDGSGYFAEGGGTWIVDSGVTVTMNSALTGPGSFTKAGGGTLILNGANTYSGSTTVTGGILTVNNSYPTTATCSGGSSNICAAPVSPTVQAVALAPVLNTVPGFSVASTTGTSTAGSLATLSTSSSSSTTSSTTTSATSSTTSSTSSSTTLTSSSPSSGTSSTSTEVQSTTAALPSDGSTLISSSNVSVVSSLESSFSTSDVGTSTTTASTTTQPQSNDTSTSSTSSSASNSSSSSTSSASQGSQASAESTNDGGSDTKGTADSDKSKSDGSKQKGNNAGSTGPVTASTSMAAGAPPTTTVPTQQAATAVTQADQQQGRQALGSLVPERAGGALVSPSVPQMQQSLSGAANQIRNGALGPQSALPGAGSERPWLLDAAEGLLANAAVSSDVGRAALLPPTFNRAAYTPAVLHVRFSEATGGTVRSDTDAFLDITLIPMQGEVEGRRVEVSKEEFAVLLRQLYAQLARQDSLNTADPASPSRRLHQLLIAPLAPVLAKQGITTLLISADRGLQAVPFSALHSGERYFGDAYAFSLTPSLALTKLMPPPSAQGRLLAAGASTFDGLAPLPLVPIELEKVGQARSKDIELNAAFTPSTLLEQAADTRYTRVHVATHAEFLPGGPAKSKLYSGTVPIPLADFAKLRLARKDAPLDLISFSACRTALGDADSELGFAGLALQAGARSAVGTLWYVDDVATSAYFVQMYRYLDAGVPKAEALQLTRQAFSRGLVRLEGDQMVGPDGTALFGGLNDAQQRRVADGLSNPYFWAGIELLGAPW